MAPREARRGPVRERALTRPQTKIYESVEEDGTEPRKVISFEVDRSLRMFRLRLGTDVNA